MKERRDPWATPPKKSIMDRITGAMRWLSSPEGLRGVGFVIFVIALWLSITFWIGTLANTAFSQAIGQIFSGNLSVLTPSAIGTIIALFSAWAQCAPIFNGSSESILSEMVAVLFRPKVSQLPKVGNEDLEAEYDAKPAKYRKLLKRLRLVAVGLELGLAGVFLFASFGLGMSGLLQLVNLIFGLIGCELGAGMIVQADEVTLTPEARMAVARLKQKNADEAVRSIG